MISFPFGLLNALLWLFLLLGAIASVVLAVLANRRPQQRRLIYAMVAALLATLLLAMLLPITPNAAAGGILTILMVVLAVAGGGPLATAVLDIATGGSVLGGSHGGILVPANGHAAGDVNAAQQPKREVMRGGVTIGILERLAVAAVIVAGYPEGLAVIIAIKGVGRFSELGEAAEARERFIIGSMVSWIWAASCAGIVLLAR
jgi:hypothetical protein